MLFYNEHRKVKLEIDESLLDKMKEIGLSFYPKEIGGFLIGHYSEDLLTLYIGDIIMPKYIINTGTSFERSTKGIESEFNLAFKERGLIYVGEWHTHPNGPSLYSSKDLNAMIEIENDKGTTIENPILLVLGIDKKKLKEFSFYLYDKKGLYRYGRV